MAHSSEPSVTDLTKGVYRRLYGGFITGQRINKLSLRAEAWFWRILAVTNRKGRVPSDIVKLRALTAGPRRVSVKQIQSWVDEMIAVRLLENVGSSELHLIDFERLQPRTVLNGSRPGIPKAVRLDVLAAGYCLMCGRGEDLSVDHIQPVSKGGSDRRDNLQCLCLPCNLRKSNKWEERAN